jgi:hypothetical protein
MTSLIAERGSTIQERITFVETIPVVDRVDNRYKGSTKALRNRTKQLLNTIFAAKQHIQVLRKTSQLAVEAHKAASTALTKGITPQTDPSIPRLGEDGQENSTDELLAETGLRSLIDKLVSAELATAKCYEKLFNPTTALNGSIKILNDHQEEINSTVFDNTRLGKAHPLAEQDLTNKANEVNDFIILLRKACMNHGVILHPTLDPYVLRLQTEYRMKDFVLTEWEYERLCVKELVSIGELETGVFTTLQFLPGGIEEATTPLMNECGKAMEAIASSEKIDPLVDRRVFVERHGNSFVPENLDPIQMDFAEDEQYKGLQVICHPDLEIYHKLERESPPSSKIPGSKTTFLDAMKRTLVGMTPAKYGYAVRGVWYISASGNLIEFNEKESKAWSIFDLRRCKLGTLAPDEMERYGYFTLEGLRQCDPSDKKTRWIKKVYKFRNKWEKAREMHKALGKICNCEGSKEVKTGTQETATQAACAQGIEPRRTQAHGTGTPEDTMAGSTLVNSNQSAAVAV